MKVRGFKEIKLDKNRKFRIPKWMECAWRRVSCGKDDCPICGRIKKDHQRHIEKGEDPNSMESALEDVGRNFKETMATIKKDCEKKGIDLVNVDEEKIQEPPEPEKFPLYNKVNKWRELVLNLNKAEDEIWIHTEPAADLFWYANTLAAKIYRQLSTKCEIDNGLDYGNVDYDYTGYVIKECLKILKKSLKDLVKFDSSQKAKLMLVHDKLLKLEKEILKIL